MIGPSSSHTAGACRIAKVAQDICGNDFVFVEFVLHGSFAETYKGHGTDRALLSGVMGFGPDDDRLRDAFLIAESKNFKYKFSREDLGKVHPNSVKIIFTYKDGHKSEVIGSSIGGGNIEIISLDGISLSYTGDFPTLILKYNEQKGVIKYVSSLLSDNNYNIESMKTAKSNDEVTLIMETDEDVDDALIKKILNNKRFKFARYISPK